MHLVGLSLLPINRCLVFTVCTFFTRTTLLFTLLVFVLVYQDLKEIGKDLDAFLNLTLDQVENSFSEIFEHGKALARKVVISGAFQAIKCLIVVLLSQS